jgi:hypothetical protein
MFAIADGGPPIAPRAKWVVMLAGAAGTALLVYLVIELGPTRVVSQLAGLGSVLPAVLLLTGMKYPLQAAGWRLALPREYRPSWSESIASTIAGDALGYLTWAGPVTGEPIRALLTRRSVPVAVGIAAGVVERGLYNATALVLVAAALLALALQTRGPGVAWALIGAVLVSAAAAWWWRARHRGSVRLPSRHDNAGAAVADRTTPGQRLLGALRDLWLRRRHVIPVIGLLCVAQHLILVYEAQVLLRVLAEATTFGTALAFEAVTKVVNTVGTLVPGRVGISEGGSALLADALGLSASHGLSLALMRRVRALIWTAVGLTLLPMQERRARRRG